jgi:peptidoglycan/xylan/chitin deacetylase (PgdA/CDA1 family)
VASYPIYGDEAVRAEFPLVIQFDRPMNRDSVNARLTFSPTVEGRVDWPTPLRLTFSPAGGWSGTAYEVILRPGAEDDRGVAMSGEFRLRFSRRGHGAPVPILMYHHLKKLGPNPSESDLTWTVSPEAFVAQMAYLAQNGWQSISPAQLVAYFTKGGPLPPRAFMITMDDGYKQVYTVAYPEFLKTGFRPVLFIVPQYTGYGAFLDWAQLKELTKAGFTIGSHGYDHTDLRKANDAEVERQVGTSQAELSRRLGVEVDAFAYPYGSYNERSLTALEKYHYVTAYTIDRSYRQSPDDLYRLHRLVISYTVSLEDFARLLPH